MGRNTVIDRDNGYNALFKRLGHPAHVTVGVHDDIGSRSLDGVVTVADVMTWAEFGLGQPERSWLRAFVDEEEKQIDEDIRKLGEAVIKGLDAEDAIEQLGASLKARIQERIANRIPPPNAPSTVARKGSDVPLIDTGQSRASVDYKAHRGAG